MTSVTVDTKVAASAEQLWQMLRQSQEAMKWNFFVSGEVEGSAGGGQTVVVPGAGVVKQRLEHVSDTERLYIYSISPSLLPVEECVAKCRVIDNGDGTSTVEWSSNFTPKGVEENEASRLFKSFFETGFQNFKKLFPT